MYRKKNAAEKATDLENSTIAAKEEHKALGKFFSEANDYGADGYVRCSWMLTSVNDAHSAACMIYRQAEETHVGDGEGMEGKWAHTTHSHVYDK
jgi:uncharacterized protein YbjQ (UPF0145 family)